MIINVKVIPKSKLNQIIKISDTDFKIKVTSPPDKGKANEKVIELLSKHFKTSKSMIAIISGQTSRNKIIEINNKL